MEKICIAIDGPASSGKSTVAKILAQDFGYIYIDTGAMYRAVTYLAIIRHVDFADEAGLMELIDSYPITFRQSEKGQLVFVKDTDITAEIRQPNVTGAVSEVSAHKGVRQKLVYLQQVYAKEGGIVMDGRDIGTAVLPDAEVKIFLVASVEERAQRRYNENIEKGISIPFAQLKAALAKRDLLDSTREVSPLLAAQDAIEIDTTGMDVPEVVQNVKKIIKNKGYNV